MLTIARGREEGSVSVAPVSRTESCGLIVSDITNSFIPELIQGFEQVAIHAGFDIGNVCVNYETGVGQAVQHLRGLGHRRLAFIRGPVKLKSAVSGAKRFYNALPKRTCGPIGDDS